MDENKEPTPKPTLNLVPQIETEPVSWKPVPRTFEDQQRIAKMYLASKVLPARFTTEAQIITALHFASEHFPGKEMTALRQIAVIEGSPCLFGDLPLALVQRSGHLEEMHEEFAGEDGKDDYRAICTVKRYNLTPITRVFSVKDAKVAGLYARQTYQKYLKRMLQMRARAWALKDGFADVLAGIAIAEYDHDQTGEEVDVTSSQSKLEKLNTVPGPSTSGVDNGGSAS